MLVPVSEKRRENVDGKQEAPKQQRALLAGPDGGNLEKSWQGAIAVLDHIRHREIVGKEQVGEAAESEPDQNAGGHARVARALQQQRLASDYGGDAAAEGIQTEQKR